MPRRRCATCAASSTVEAFTRTLLGAKAVAYPSKGASGLYFVSLLDRMGIKAEMQSRLKPMAAEDTVEVVARGEADMVVLVPTRITGVSSVDAVGPIPQALQTEIGFAAGLSASAKDPYAAKASIRFLAAPEAKATLWAKASSRPECASRKSRGFARKVYCVLPMANVIMRRD